MAGWFLFVKMKHNVEKMSHIRHTERKLDYRYMPPMQCCPFYHYSILIRIGYPKNCYFLHRKLKLNEREKSQSKFQLKGIIFSDGKIAYHHSIEYYIFVCSIHHYLFYVLIPQRSHCISSIVFFVPSFWKIASTILRYGWKTHFMIWVTQRRKFQPNFLEKNKNKC